MKRKSLLRGLAVPDKKTIALINWIRSMRRLK